jgi:hypothetical protein
MSSLRRICASRANGHLSRGPATPQGKLRSARTSLRHGLLARCVALEDECPRTVAAQPPGASLGRLADALSGLAGGPAIALIHRYEARLHLMCQRSLHNFRVLRLADAPGAGPPNRVVPNEPNPISGHLRPPADESAPLPSLTLQ